MGSNGILLATIITIILIGHGYGGWIVFHYYFKGKSFMTFVMKQVGYLVMIAVACYVTDLFVAFPRNSVDTIIECRYYYTIFISDLTSDYV